MATRGVYRVDGVYLYNHWDNYPSGAREHLSEVLEKYGKLDLFSVIRGMNVSQAISPQDGGSEFYYVIENNFIQQYNVDGKELTLTDQGTIEDWINRGVQDKFIKVYGQYMRQSQAHEKGVEMYEDAVQKLIKGHIGNASNQFRESFVYLNLAGGDFSEIVNEYKRKYSPKLAEAFNHSDTELFDSYVNNSK
jgi:hypothetical protein